ncbi:unnamed protein product [Camellia sinensis]
MTSLASRFVKLLRVPCTSRPNSSFVVGMQGSSKLCYSTFTVDSDNDNDGKNKESEDYDDDFLAEKPELQPQSVDPRRGWGFRGVHKTRKFIKNKVENAFYLLVLNAFGNHIAIICGKVGQAPVQKILRNGRTVTIFTVGTGGMFDQRIVGAKDLPKPAQWHRIAVHNEPLGAYAVQQLIKNSSVYVEGDIETRVYNDSINGEVKHVPEICVRRDGKIRLVKTGESTSNICFDELRNNDLVSNYQYFQIQKLSLSRDCLRRSLSVNVQILLSKRQSGQRIIYL